MPVLPSGLEDDGIGTDLASGAAASIMAMAMRSLTCAGLKNSSLAGMVAPVPSARRLISQQGIADQFGHILGDAHVRYYSRLVRTEIFLHKSILAPKPGRGVPDNCSNVGFGGYESFGFKFHRMDRRLATCR